MNFNKVVAKCVKAFQTGDNTDLKSVLESHESDFRAAFTKKTRPPSDEPKKTNWQAVWTSNDNGCRSYTEFGPVFARLKEENPKSKPFSLNKIVKEWAVQNGKYQEWQNWARSRLEAAGKPVPQDTHSANANSTTADSSAASATVASVEPTKTEEASAPVSERKPRGKKAK